MKNLLFIAIAAVIALTSCNSSPKLSGAGATFPAPYYNLVFKKFTETSGSNVTYGAVGSGGGIRSLKDKTVDFGATDVFLSDKELQEMGSDVLHIPTALGAVVVSYNLPEIKDLKLNSALISKIYRGEITNWNDEQIKALNPGLNLPNQAITPVYRSDGSGTTSVFSEYMSKTDSLWNKDLGTGKSIKFKFGVAAKGNPGVAGIVKETVGSIGYIGSEYALALNIPSALLQNSSGNFVAANDKSISASAETEIPDDTRLIITNSNNPEAYPISTFTWIIVYKEQNYNKRTVEQAKTLTSLLQFIISKDGQDLAIKTHYAPLSAKAVEKTDAIIKSMTFDGQPIK
ncbi:phosphate ABC transporter substrate-binding protein PstS [Dysgonomonas capnocytophagoides]|uniref:Phosphate-binding protein n=1 Tax=Dysgonomonas capnocytophagoides TaxID=45254 RepID=A0A4Y8KW04_9BACT|nr:phosphate ABC transporter substrate-binding protein PstS [Dysgonomonas capnocytophagoides]TFD94239.1 phosphate ABC transporter substrate-binding protein PstS [Dysgonomonas capnocytophagoides]